MHPQCESPNYLTALICSRLYFRRTLADILGELVSLWDSSAYQSLTWAEYSALIQSHLQNELSESLEIAIRACGPASDETQWTPSLDDPDLCHEA